MAKKSDYGDYERALPDDREPRGGGRRRGKPPHLDQVLEDWKDLESRVQNPTLNHLSPEGWWDFLLKHHITRKSSSGDMSTWDQGHGTKGTSDSQ